MDIRVSPELEKTIKRHLNGRFPTPEAVVEEAVRRLDAQLETTSEQGVGLLHAAWLADWDAFIASLPPGNPNADYSRDSIYGADP